MLVFFFGCVLALGLGANLLLPKVGFIVFLAVLGAFGLGLLAVVFFGVVVLFGVVLFVVVFADEYIGLRLGAFGLLLGAALVNLLVIFLRDAGNSGVNPSRRLRDDLRDLLLNGMIILGYFLVFLRVFFFRFFDEHLLHPQLIAYLSLHIYLLPDKQTVSGKPCMA